MCFTVWGVRVRVSFLLAVTLCIGALLPGRLLPLLFAAVLFHECGHFAYILMKGSGVAEIAFSVTGVRVMLSDGQRLTPGEELLLNLCGPAANILVGAVMLLSGGTVQAIRAAAVHFSVAAATLLPLGSSDGTVVTDILLERLCKKLPEYARRRLRRLLGAVLAVSILAVCGAFG